MSDFRTLDRVLAGLDRTVTAWAKDAPLLAAQTLREHIARDFAQSRNAAGASLRPYGAAWGLTKRELGLRLNRGQAAGGIMSALRSSRSVKRVSNVEAIVNPEMAGAVSPYPAALGGPRAVNRYIHHYNRQKAGGDLMAVSEAAAAAVEAVLDKHLEVMLERV